MLKAGVEIFGLRPELLLAMMVANDVAKYYNVDFVVTSCTEKTTKHRSGSLHYAGFAFDMRNRDIHVGLHTSVKEKLQSSLGKEFDVIVEKDHIHVEFQPKG